MLPVSLILLPLFLSNLIVGESHFQEFQRSFEHSNANLLGVTNWRSFIQILGLSYLSFNAISYLIDVDRRYIEPEKNFFKLLLYLIFLPLVFSGPLHRYQYLSQHFEGIEVTNDSLSRGFRLALFGFFKMLIASRLFEFLVKLQSTSISGLYYLLVGTLFFFFLYLSFSSFIDLSQGIVQLFGIRAKDNFSNRVYFSSSRQEFWKGWHITLNHWFRDYLFFPLAKRDRKRRFTDVILLITFLAIAVWHGFTIALLFWGIANGVWIILERKMSFKLSGKLKSVLGPFYHLVLSSLLALIFISSDISETFKRLVGPTHFPSDFINTFGINPIIVLGCFLLMDFHNMKANDKRFDDYLENKSTIYRWAVYLKLTFILMFLGTSFDIGNYYNQF